jgi:biopolymer transport protein ExbD
MADVTFLLIIYFVISGAFAATRGLDLNFAPDLPAEIDPVEAVLVEVRAPGELVVDRRPMALVELLDYLRPRLAQNSDKPVILKALEGAPYGAMVDVLDELRQGRERLGLDREISVALPTEREQALWWR